MVIIADYYHFLRPTILKLKYEKIVVWESLSGFMPQSLKQLECKIIDELSIDPNEKIQTQSIMMLVKISRLQIVTSKCPELDHHNVN